MAPFNPASINPKVLREVSKDATSAMKGLAISALYQAQMLDYRTVSTVLLVAAARSHICCMPYEQKETLQAEAIPAGKLFDDFLVATPPDVVEEISDFGRSFYLYATSQASLQWMR